MTFTAESAWTLRNCQIQTLYVNFKDLNWHVSVLINSQNVTEIFSPFK